MIDVSHPAACLDPRATRRRPRPVTPGEKLMHHDSDAGNPLARPLHLPCLLFRHDLD